ncbi:sulfatase family protein [Salegentibacter chungangensis]|uniref:Arylsulfatase n=1 Tax=Salegentibacter chungangensis TaxID=1335724 RepID=A0ABW3NP97_9FLAO
MNKLIFYIFIIFGVTLNAQRSEKPNVIIILADDMGVGDISGINPDSKIATPNIDKLLKKGIRFTDGHSSSSVCTPSRYSLLTGQYSWRTRLKKKVLHGDSRAMIDPSVKTIAGVFKNSDYKTAMIGKWHLGWDWQTKNGEILQEDPENPYWIAKNDAAKIDYRRPFKGGPTDRGFDYFYGINASLDMPPYTFIENNKVETLPDSNWKGQGRKSEGPKAHQKFMRGGVAKPGFDPQQVFPVLKNKTIEYIQNADAKAPFFLYVSLTAPHTPVLPDEKFKGKSEAGAYGDFIEQIDAAVGDIVAAVEEKQISENTIIIFTADNGASKSSFPKEFEAKFDHKPSYNFRGRKGSLHQGGHAVPFIVSWPGIDPKTIDTPVLQNDFLMTFADLLDVEIDENEAVDSFSLMPLITGDGTYHREASVYNNFGGWLSIRMGDWKMDMTRSRKKTSLYHIKQDPQEELNLAGKPKYREIQQKLKEKLSEIILNGRSTPGRKLKNEGPEIWDQLFWLKP